VPVHARTVRRGHPVFQNARQDPKYRVDASTYLGRAFMDAGFMDEAVDTMRDAIEIYPIKGDPKSTDMTYYYGRALEAKGDVPAALKQYSQVAQWNFNYRDVQARIKNLRNPPQK
jgi:tetratricopeptide (TPR) repeat protein